MVHLWRSRTKEEAETTKAPGVGATGDIAVIVEGKKLDTELVRLACLMAKRAKRKVHLVHIIEVPRTLPLKAVLTEKSNAANKLLSEAIAIAEEAGCDAVAEIVQARDAGPAIVDEARDHGCALIMLGLVRSHRSQNNLGKTIPYVLLNAPCRVWVIQDPNGTAAAGTPATAATSSSDVNASKE
ncbi:MAG: universal stress protein [Thermogemmatispora sp.]|uniref:universal stress protein n=1 Tax=Thermogemmatispora sp. TaxID=1968838 RepID=UPI00262EDD80|nr:universal stress protein [Thermogemmatispora sp.]MBX5455982.1 universal stress protein [Thermogemmatispora sp.]